MNCSIDYFENCVALLKSLISTPSFSNEEDAVADIWEEWLKINGADVRRLKNNVYSISTFFDHSKPTLLLNSHLDTVKPSPSYTRNPFEPSIEGEKLYGLGSNDAGASGVSLAATFLSLKDKKDLPLNLILAITASEEKMGEFGMRTFLPFLKDENLYPDMAIVGEPTGLNPAIAERGLVVLDGIVSGKAGHAARNEGVNAIYYALNDINVLKDFKFPNISNLLGPIKVSVTMINAGTQHNVIPDKCEYVVDVRTTDAYSNEQTVKILQDAVKHSILTPRSTRINASVLDTRQPLYKAIENLKLSPFISPTTSDMALLCDIPSLKIGPGDSARSHSADEYILLSEIKDALKLYPQLINNIKPTR